LLAAVVRPTWTPVIGPVIEDVTTTRP